MLLFKKVASSFLLEIDLMTDVTINRAKAVTKEEVGLLELNDLFEYRMENPYMFTGKVERVRIRIDADQFTQVVDFLTEGKKARNPIEIRLKKH